MKSVRIYTTTYCSFCDRAKELLRRKGIAFEEIDVTEDQELRARLVEMTGGLRTVPQIWIGSTHVGGYSDLARLDREGRLDPLLRATAAAGA
jgi:glutaredoxin 3